MRYYTLILCILFSTVFYSQNTNTLPDNKTLKKYNKAYECLMKKDELKYLDKIKDIMALYPDYVEGHKDLAMYYLSKGQKEDAYPHIMVLAEQDNKLSARVGGELMDIYDERKDFDKAIATAKKIMADNRLREDSKAKLNRRIQEFEFRKNAYANPVDFSPERLDTNINTTNSEYLPAFNADASIMIYTTRNTEGDNIHEDLYVTLLQEDSTYSQGQVIEELQTEENEGAHTFSKDGTILIFTACDRRDSRGGCDLYITFLKADGWSEPRNLGPAINSRYWDSQPCLSADNKTLYFTSKRPKGFGVNDIWMSQLKDIGGWSAPVNLGPTINTKGNEQSPYFHPDNTTLYFESDGHIGMGESDLFISRRENDEWSDPINLGYPINNEYHQGALFVDVNGNNAYYASEDTSSTIQHLDIYKFELPEEHKPLANTYFKVNVIDAVSKKPIVALVELRNLVSGSASVQRTNQNGSSMSTVTPGNFSVNVNKEGYVFHSENILIEQGNRNLEPKTFNIELYPIAEEAVTVKSEPIILENIFFESGSSTLLESSNYEIEKLYQLLTKNESMKIQIIGHTDNVGSDGDNMMLSDARAKSVYEVLVEKGIDKSRISYTGMGESKPIADNNTPEGQKTNRRTEFIIIP